MTTIEIMIIVAFALIATVGLVGLFLQKEKIFFVCYIVCGVILILSHLIVPPVTVVASIPADQVVSICCDKCICNVE